MTPASISPQRATLCKAERLTRKKLIEELNSKGRSLKSPAVVLVYLMVDFQEDFPAQVMFTAPKRLYKRAHDRNKIKRLFREAYRKQKTLLYDSLLKNNRKAVLMFIFTGRQLPNAAYIHHRVGDMLKQLSNIVATAKSEKDT
jgi:ribonuclease P protein component